MINDHLHVNPGEFPTADGYNEVVDLASRRIPRPFIDLSRGGSGVEGEWIVVMLLENLLAGHTALAVQMEYEEDVGWKPTTTIVTVQDTLEQSGGIALGQKVLCQGVDGVWYATNGACQNMQGTW